MLMRCWHGGGLRAVLALLSAGGLACGGSTLDTTNPDGGAEDGGGGGADSTVDGGGILDTGSLDTDLSEIASPEAGSPDAVQDTGVTDSTGDAGTVSCSTYCAAVMAACTGANAQYKDNASCLNACQYLQPGTEADTSGNTVGCRITHASLAMATPNPHCWHAGPFGYGGCGQPCEGFCDIAAGFCSPTGGFDGAAPPYNSQGDCILHCAGYAMVDTPTNLVSPPGMVGVDGGYSANGPDTGDTLDCREYYLGSALQGGTAQQLHCNQLGPTSLTCM
jgi:hypothetical protein